jgi:nucleotide-binding universal stress UspA family protein
MLMFDVIVVGTDGSETAAVAVKKALEIAQIAGGTVHVVHAHHLVSAGQVATSTAYGAAPNIDIDEVNKGLEAQSRSVVQGVAAEAERAGVQCETHVRDGDPARALIDVAEKVGADLLVVGNRGMSGVRRMLGSVPNKVSHHCTCSLLIVDTTAP